MSPKVSIVVPVYNVEKYLEECLLSIQKQTLEDIEAIIVNDGSTDGSLEIAQRFEQEDPRFRVLSKENRGYGHTMNLGFRNATGEYIGIVESDDCARPAMFEKLYEQAKAHNAQVVRSNYFTMGNEGTEFGLIDVLSTADAPFYESFNPQDHPGILRGSPAIWTTIYKRSFIEEEGIAFLESPGASYQDTGFLLKVWSVATNVVIMREAFLNYRIDNANSSVKSGAKVFCVSDEYAELKRFMTDKPRCSMQFLKALAAKKYETYLWNYNRLDKSLRSGFLNKMTEEFSDVRAKALLDEALFSPEEWSELNKIIDDPDSLELADLTVAAPRFNRLNHQKTRCVNRVISKPHYLAWRTKHIFDTFQD